MSRFKMFRLKMSRFKMSRIQNVQYNTCASFEIKFCFLAFNKVRETGCFESPRRSVSKTFGN